MAHTGHNPDPWSEITLTVDVLHATTFTTVNFLYLTATVRPILQAGLLRWYMCDCNYLIYNEMLDEKVLKIKQSYEQL